MRNIYLQEYNDEHCHIYSIEVYAYNSGYIENGFAEYAAVIRGIY